MRQRSRFTEQCVQIMFQTDTPIPATVTPLVRGDLFLSVKDDDFLAVDFNAHLFSDKCVRNRIMDMLHVDGSPFVYRVLSHLKASQMAG